MEDMYKDGMWINCYTLTLHFSSIFQELMWFEFVGGGRTRWKEDIIYSFNKYCTPRCIRNNEEQVFNSFRIADLWRTWFLFSHLKEKTTYISYWETLSELLSEV